MTPGRIARSRPPRPGGARRPSKRVQLIPLEPFPLCRARTVRRVVRCGTPFGALTFPVCLSRFCTVIRRGADRSSTASLRPRIGARIPAFGSRLPASAFLRILRIGLRSERSAFDPMTDSRPAPTCFISYSWDSPEHRAWVMQLATALRASGVDAILDAFHAPLGTDLAAFMDRIATSDVVLLVCTPGFRAKSATGAAGGVGYEQAIITGQIFTGAARPEKFIPILRAGSVADSLPAYLLNRHWADFRDDARFAESLDRLLRALLASPEHAVPPLGPRPVFAAPGFPGDAPRAFRVRYFETFDLNDDDPVAAPRYANIWTIGDDGPWRGSIRDGVYRLANAHDTDAVRYGYVGLGPADGSLDDLSDTRVSVDVRVGSRDTCPFTSAGLMFRFDRSRRFYSGLVLTRQVRGDESRAQLQLVTRNERGFGLTPLGMPDGLDTSGIVTLGIEGRGAVLDLVVNDRPFRSVPAPAGLQGDPGLIALGSGQFEFDNFTIASAT